MTVLPTDAPMSRSGTLADPSSGARSNRLAEGAQQRLTRLSERAGALRGRRAGNGVDDRWLLVVGSISMPLGVVLILLGWYGSAQTALPFEQTPYLISGGILGLALVVGGGLLYFAYWLTLLVREGRADRERVAEHQDRLEHLLAQLAGRLDAASASPERVVRTPSGTLLHRPDCAATRGLDVIEVPTSLPRSALCGLCQPVAPPSAPEVVATARVRRPRTPRAPRMSPLTARPSSVLPQET